MQCSKECKHPSKFLSKEFLKAISLPFYFHVTCTCIKGDFTINSLPEKLTGRYFNKWFRVFKISYELTFVVAVNKPVTISSIYQPAFKPSHAVDDITVCSKWDLHIKSNLQFRPWIKIDFQGIYNVHSVVIYNTQSGNGKCIIFTSFESLRCSIDICLCSHQLSVESRFWNLFCNKRPNGYYEASFKSLQPSKGHMHRDVIFLWLKGRIHNINI